MTSNSPSVCTVGVNNLNVTYVAVRRARSLTAHVVAGTNYTAGDGRRRPSV